MEVVGEDFFEVGEGGGGLLLFDEEFCELDAGAGVGVVFEDLLPDADGGVDFSKGGEGFGVGHECVAVVVFWIFGADLLEEWFGFLGALLAEEGLTEVGAGVDVGGLAFEGGAIGFFGFVEFSFAKVDVAELEVVVGFVEVIDLCFKFFDALTGAGAGEFETGGGGVVAEDL